MNKTFYILLFFMIAGGVCPPVATCWDSCIIPKWTICSFCALALLSCIVLYGLPPKEKVARCVAFSAIMGKTFTYMIIAGCYLPPILGFSDACLMPKWYVAVFFLILFIANQSVRLCREGRTCLELVPFVYGLSIACVFESLVAISQFLSSSCAIVTCGHFDNPASLAFALAVPFPALLMLASEARTDAHKVLAIMAIACVACAVFATKSRTGIIALALIGLIKGSSTVKNAVATKYAVAGVFFVSSCVILALAFKRPSTDGRAFIAGKTIEAICDNPFRGYGHGGFQKHYMGLQAAYFRSHPDDANANLADDMKHPLNEFLLVWFELGIVGLVVFAAAVLYPLAKLTRLKDPCKKAVGECLLVLFVFSLFSYPFNYPLAWVVLSLGLYESLLAGRDYGVLAIQTKKALGAAMVLACGVALCLHVRSYIYNNEWGTIYRKSLKGMSADMMPRYRALSCHLGDCPQFLYSYAMEAFIAGETDEAYGIAVRCRERMASYNLELLLGDIAREQGRHEVACAHYKLASEMCPVRFAPLEGLLLCYSENPQNREQARATAVKILQKAVKVHSPDTYRIKKLAKDYICENYNCILNKHH